MKEIITFFGADPCVGISMISQSTAEILSESNKVLLIYASANPFCDYYGRGNAISSSIDDLRPYLRHKNLTADKINNICFKNKNLTILPPVKNLALVRYYKEYDLIDIVNTVKDQYDYIVIDGGASIQYSLNISALLCATRRYIVVTQQTKTLNRYRLLDKTLLSPLDMKHNVLVNKYDKNIHKLSLNFIKEFLGDKQLLSIKLCENGLDAEINKETLLKHPTYKRDINRLINEVCDHYS